MPHGVCRAEAAGDVRWTRRQDNIIIFPGSGGYRGAGCVHPFVGYKNILKFNFQKRVEFNDRLCERIEREFPEETVIRELNVCR